jgi:Leucine-rich repeat (LRR) protein
VTDDGARALATHTALTRLSLASAALTDAGALALCSLSNLTQLSLSRCYEVGGKQAAAALAALPALTSLDLSYCPKVRVSSNAALQQLIAVTSSQRTWQRPTAGYH